MVEQFQLSSCTVMLELTGAMSAEVEDGALGALPKDLIRLERLSIGTAASFDKRAEFIDSWC